MEKEDEAVPEKAVLHTAKGTFRVIKAEPRKLLNGNKLHVVIEAELDTDLAQVMVPLFDKDCTVSFKELAAQKTYKEKKAGQRTFDPEGEGEGGVGPE